MTTETGFIEGDWRRKCLDALVDDSYSVFAPGRDGDVTRFRRCESVEQVVLDRVNTDYPLKEVFLPMTENILNFRLSQGRGESCSTPEIKDMKTAVFGCRPCDAASSVAVLDKVFNWDYGDSFFNARRRNSLILSIGCARSDDRCFCTTVGLAPDSGEGSDWLIQEVGDRGAMVTICSERGKVFAEAHRDMISDLPGDVSPAVAEVPVKVDVEKIKPWLDEHFEDDFWEDIAMSCLGCGVCSYLCPTCHCFDIVDEGNWQGGERRRNYDCCSYALFTHHTSGHNPRPTQASRWRNRLMHKFHYFVERFGCRACVGCGRCARLCGAGISLVSILQQIESRAEENSHAEA